jgi:hypothetical protein
MLITNVVLNILATMPVLKLYVILLGIYEEASSVGDGNVMLILQLIPLRIPLRALIGCYLHSQAVRFDCCMSLWAHYWNTIIFILII